MPEYVSREAINQGVVREWSRLVSETARDKREDLSAVRPFHPYEQTYSEVLEEVRKEALTHQGLVFYRMMVPMCPGFDFEDRRN